MSKTILFCLNIALRLGWVTLALAVCLPVTAQQPSPDWIRCVNLGNAYSPHERIDGCTAVLRSGRDTTADRAIAYSSRGNAYRAKGDHDRGIADYSEAIRLNPNFAGFYYNRGLAYRYKKDYHRAIADFDVVIRLNPRDAEAYYNRGLMYEALGRREEAVAEFRRALSIIPNFPNAREALKRLGVTP